MNSRGQFWSLDIILAASIFTLAIGLILSSSELSIFYSQQEKNSSNLLSIALLASNNLVSRNDIPLSYVPPECSPPLGGNLSRCSLGPPACFGIDPCPILDISNAILNARCGPNAKYVADFGPPLPAPQITPTLTSTPFGWLADNELSGLESCIVDSNSVFRQGPLGFFPEYNIDMNARLSNGAYLSFYMAHPGTQNYFSFNRRMMIFPESPTAAELRQCMDGGCAGRLTDLNLRVWGT